MAEGQWDAATRYLQSGSKRGQTLCSTNGQRALEATKVGKCFGSDIPHAALWSHKKKYREWFYNHKKRKAQAKPPMRLQKKWTARRVIEEERKADILQKIRDEIEDETGRKAGQKEVLKRYQPMMTAVMKTLDNDELEQAQAKADEWTNQAPDATVQAKTAKKKGEKMVKHFAKEMFTQAGMRVFVLGTWKDEKGGLLTSG